MTRRRTNYYNGLLARPVVADPSPFEPGKAYNPSRDTPPGMVSRFNQALKILQAEETRRRFSITCRYELRMSLLCSEIGVEIGNPGWERQVWFVLASRHEPELMSDLEFRFELLFRRYCIDPSEEDADFSLAFTLACKYVPGFELVIEEVKHNHLNDAEITDLVGAISLVEGQLLGAQRTKHPLKRATVSQIATILRDPRQRLQFVPAPLLRPITLIVEEGGYRPWRNPNPATHKRTLWQYVADTQNAWDAYLHDEANAFQIIVVEKARPFWDRYFLQN